MTNVKIFPLLLIAVLIVSGCSDDNDSPPNNNSTTGHLELRLTDAPTAYDEVNVTFTSIEVNHDENWLAVLLDTAMTVNLLEWNNGQSIKLGEGDFPPGFIKEVRLIISQASIVVDGTEYPMDVPSGSSSGLKIKVRPEMLIEAGASYVLVLDFDAQQSVKTTGSPSNPKGYKLQPVIRAVAEAVTGSISGIVTNPEHYAVAVAKDSTGASAGSTVAENPSGLFTIGYLPAGTYSVEITDTLSQMHTTTGVVVNVGQNNDIGTVTLQ